MTHANRTTGIAALATACAGALALAASAIATGQVIEEDEPLQGIPDRQRQTTPRLPNAPVLQNQQVDRLREIQELERNIPQLNRPDVLINARRGPEIANLGLLDRIGEYDRPLRVYRAAQPGRGFADSMREMAGRLGETAGVSFELGDPMRLDETRYGFRSPDDPSASFEYDTRTGAFLFEAGLADMRGEESTPRLPEAPALAELARRHLEELGVAPEPNAMRVAHLGGLNMGVPDGAGGTRVFEKLKTVRFQRMLDGLPVEGDSRVVAHLGEAGQLHGLVHQWPRAGRGQTLAAGDRTPPDVLRRQAMQRLQAMTRRARSARLSSVALVMFDDGRGILEPAYHIAVERMMPVGEEGAMIPYDFYLPVSQEPQALFPFMEQAEVAPGDGESEAELPNEDDE